MRDKLILLGWITGLLLLVCVFWISTQTLQANHLMRTINSVLFNNEDYSSAENVIRLSAYMPKKSKNAGLMGYWYSIHNSSDLMFVFMVFQDGILVPLGAIVSPDGTVQDVIPLSSHALQVYEKLPQSILKMYIMRIEEVSLR